MQNGVKGFETPSEEEPVKGSASSPTLNVGPSPVGEVSIQKDLQTTAPSRPLKNAFPRANLGDSGTRLLHGIITEEYNPELQGIEGIKKFDEMRKSDGTCRAAMLVCTLPIRRAEWFIKPANDTPEAEEQAAMVRHALFDWLDITWDDFIRQALLMAPFGVMLFEKVYGTHDDEDTGATYVTPTRLAPRLPKSILMWELVDRSFGIQQIRQDGVLAQIPGSKLLIFVNEREGDNWWGTSMLRGAYKHYYFKNGFYKIDAVAFERQGLGVPYFKMPVGYSTADEQNAKNALANLRANAEAYVIIPPDYEVGFLDMGAKTTRDPSKSIDHHNKEILQSVLAQFLELGQTKSNSGSKALSQDHSDLFLKGMEAMANTIRDTINKDLIRELVDLNFDNVKDYPVIDYSGISKVDVASVGTALGQLATGGFIHPTNDDEQWIRAAIGMPPRSQEDIDAADDEDPSSEELVDPSDTIEDVEEDDDADAGEEDGTGAPANGKPAPNTPKPKPGSNKPNQSPKKNNQQVDDAATNKKPKDTEKPTAKTPTAKPKGVDPNTPPKSNAAAKKPAASKPTPKKAEHSHVLERELKRKFSTVSDDGKSFMSWRPLTFAEDKVRWQDIQDALDKMQDDFSVQAKDMLNNAKDDFMAKIHEALKNGDAKSISDLEVAFVSNYKNLLKTAMEEAYEYGKKRVTGEMHLPQQPSTQATLASIDLQADTIAQKTATDLETKAKLTAANAVRDDSSPLQTAGAIDTNLEEAIETAVDNTAPVIIGMAMNAGRNDVFQRNIGMIQSLQRSEILDEKTCNFCLSMDGRVIEPTDDWADAGIFHSNCRGIWVEILADEVNPPEIDGVPKEVGDNYGGEVNSLVQPKTPIVKPGGLADMYLKRKAAAASNGL